MEFYTAERKKELLPIATAWMDLESIMLNEVSLAVKGKYHMISPIFILIHLTNYIFKRIYFIDN